MRRAWVLQVRNQALGFVREPAVLVFNLLVPLFIVLIEAVAFGSTDLQAQLPGYRVVDTLPALACIMFAMIIGVFGMSVGLASMIESRTLAGASLRPGGVPFMVTSYAVVLLAITVIGLTASIAVLFIGWHIRPPSQPLLVALIVLLGTTTMTLLGAWIAGLVGSPRAAQGVASAIFFPMLFLSGAIFPIDSIPLGLQTLAKALPGYHMYELVAALWLVDQPFPAWSLAYLGVAMLLLVPAIRLSFSRREGV